MSGSRESLVSPMAHRRALLSEALRRYEQDVREAVCEDGADFARLLMEADLVGQSGWGPRRVALTAVQRERWSDARTLSALMAHTALAQLSKVSERKLSANPRFAEGARLRAERIVPLAVFRGMPAGAEVDLVGTGFGLPLMFALHDYEADQPFRRDFYQALILAHHPATDVHLRNHYLECLRELVHEEEYLWRMTTGDRIPWAFCMRAASWFGRSASTKARPGDLRIFPCCGGIGYEANPRKDASLICTACAQAHRGDWPRNARMPSERATGWWLWCEDEDCEHFAFEGRGSMRYCRDHSDSASRKRRTRRNAAQGMSSVKRTQ